MDSRIKITNLHSKQIRVDKSGHLQKKPCICTQVLSQLVQRV